MSKFTSFVTLKVVICIGSVCVENVFRLGGLGYRRGPGDVDVCPNGGIGAVGARCWVGRERYVEWPCRRVGSDMEHWFNSHGGVRVEIIGLC
jgi:hypothetical protein